MVGALWAPTMPAPHARLHAVTSPRVSPGLDGVRVGHLSDIHVRGGVHPRALHHAVERLNALQPDVVLLTGDYVCLSAGPLPRLTEALRKLAAPAWAVLGNHDHWAGAHRVRRGLEAAGVEVLRNEYREVSVRGAALHLVGVDDPVTGRADAARAFAGVPPGATALCLVHAPRALAAVAPHAPALVLCGHTHGGQLYVRGLTPWLSARLGVPHLAGLFHVDGAWLYVSRGLGASVPVRLGAPREFACLTLRSAQPSTSGTGSSGGLAPLAGL